MKNLILYKLNGIIITFIFSIAIFTPLIMGIFEEDKYVSIIEKRSLATFPTIKPSIDSVNKFPKLFDTYYTDHFGLRDWLVSYYKLVKFNLGDSPSVDVILGNDGWLFLGSIKKGYSKYSDPIGDVRNVNLFSENDLKAFSEYMIFLNGWLNSRGIKYIFVIAPNKHTIYIEKLPGYISKTNTSSSTDQLVNYLEQHTDIEVVDLRDKLMQKKNEHQLYFKTDTHWNHFGANIAQYEIMLKTERLFPKLIEPELVEMKDGIRDGGDLASFIGLSGLSESNPYPVFENTCKPIRSPKKNKDTEPHSYSCEGQKLNVLIYRDSFFSALQPYFSRKFKHSTYIWENLSFSSLKKYVDLKNPDIVIEEWVERSLPHVPKFSPELFSELNKQRFVCSDNPIFFNNFKNLRFNEYIKNIKEKNMSLLIESTGKDPIINFPLLPIEKNNQYIVHIELESSVKSMLQLFYSHSDFTGYPFSETNSIRTSVKTGANDIYIALDYKNIGRRLRLDPLSGIGEVKIKTIEIRKINNQPSTKSIRTK